MKQRQAPEGLALRMAKRNTKKSLLTTGWIAKFLTLSMIFVSAFFSTLSQADNSITLDCMILPEMYIELSSPVDGVLAELQVSKGDSIKRGQVLAKLEASVESARVALAEVEAKSLSEINHRKTQLDFAVRNRGRIESLAKANSTSKQEKDKADTEAILGQIEYERAMERAKVSQLNLNLARAQLSQKTITSPINGIVVERYAMVGESVNDRPILKLAQIDPLRVELVAPSKYFGLIKKDMEVTITPDRPANSQFIATVTMVDQIIDPASGSFTIDMSLPNPKDQFISGISCLAEFVLPTH